MNRHDSKIVSPSPPSTIGGSPAKRAVKANKATPDNTHLQIEADRVADAIPTPQDTHKETPTICRVRTSATTVKGRDTSVGSVKSHSDPVERKYISNPHRRRLPIHLASS